MLSDSGEKIVCAVTLDASKVMAGVPIFVAASPEEREKLSRYLGSILGAEVHDLENGVYILVQH